MKNGVYTLVVAPENYPGLKYRGKYAYEHHIIWWKHLGSLLVDGYEIHHINGNHRDNRIENLKCMSSSEHSSLHGSRKPRNRVILKCPGCGKIFIKDRRHTHLSKKRNKVTCCSRPCTGRWKKIKEDIIEMNKRMQENVIREYIEYSSVA